MGKKKPFQRTPYIKKVLTEAYFAREKRACLVNSASFAKVIYNVYHPPLVLLNRCLNTLITTGKDLCYTSGQHWEQHQARMQRHLVHNHFKWGCIEEQYVMCGFLMLPVGVYKLHSCGVTYELQSNGNKRLYHIDDP